MGKELYLQCNTFNQDHQLVLSLPTTIERLCLDDSVLFNDQILYDLTTKYNLKALEFHNETDFFGLSQLTIITNNLGSSLEELAVNAPFHPTHEELLVLGSMPKLKVFNCWFIDEDEDDYDPD